MKDLDEHVVADSCFSCFYEESNGIAHILDLKNEYPRVYTSVILNCLDVFDYVSELFKEPVRIFVYCTDNVIRELVFNWEYSNIEFNDIPNENPCIYRPYVVDMFMVNFYQGNVCRYDTSNQPNDYGLTEYRLKGTKFVYKYDETTNTAHVLDLYKDMGGWDRATKLVNLRIPVYRLLLEEIQRTPTILIYHTLGRIERIDSTLDLRVDEREPTWVQFDHPDVDAQFLDFQRGQNVGQGVQSVGGAVFEMRYDETNNIVHVVDLCNTSGNLSVSVTNVADEIERYLIRMFNPDVRIFMYGTDNIVAEFSRRNSNDTNAFRFLGDDEPLIDRSLIYLMYQVNYPEEDRRYRTEL